MTESRLKEQRAKSQEDLGEGLQTTNRSPASIQDDGELARRNIQELRESNSLVPINRLPTELLIAIFHTSLEAFPIYFKKLKDIASVAWKWYIIVKQSPVLWAVVDSRTPTSQLPLFLQRAGDSPLTIWMDKNTSSSHTVIHHSIPMPEIAAFLDLVLPELARWKQATLYLRNKRPGISETLGRLEQPAPLLRRFLIDTQLLEWGSQVDLFQGHAPHLAELTLYHLPIRWNSSIFHDLLSISIQNIERSGPTVEDVLQWIVSCPRLRSFHLQCVAFSPSTHHQDVPPIELPHLRSLDLRWLLESPIQLILSRIRAPALRDLIVAPRRPALGDGIHPQTFFNNSILHFSPTIRSSIDHAQGLAISMNVSEGNTVASTTPFLGSSDEGITIFFHHPPGVSVLQSCIDPLLRDVSFCYQISLTLTRLNSGPETDLVWILASEINNRVTELTIQHVCFLEFLCKERHLDGAATWPLPKLKKLSIGYQVVVSVERLTRLLGQRYTPYIGGTSTTPQPPAISVAPDRLKRLYVGNHTVRRSDYDSFAKIVGAGVLEAPNHYDDPRT